jgi:hypothetical protein
MMDPAIEPPPPPGGLYKVIAELRKEINIRDDKIRGMNNQICDLQNRLSVAQATATYYAGEKIAREHVGAPEPKPKPYRCGVCGTNDPLLYMRCYHGGCPDGRDR